MDSPSRPPVPAFGAWRDEGPESPKIDYAQAFARARASRLGTKLQREESRDFNENYSFHYQSDSEPSSSDSTESYVPSVVRSRRRIFQFFVCGSRKITQAIS